MLLSKYTQTDSVVAYNNNNNNSNTLVLMLDRGTVLIYYYPGGYLSTHLSLLRLQSNNWIRGISYSYFTQGLMEILYYVVHSNMLYL